VAAIALRMRAPLVPVHAVRTANDSSTVTIYPPIHLVSTGDRDRDTREGTQLVAHILEEMIRKAPEQWVVLQPIWPDPPIPMPEPAKEEEQPAEPKLLADVVDARVPAPADLADRPSSSRSA